LAVGTDDGYRAYFPIAHELGGNMDRKIVLRWAKEQFSRPNQPKVGANILYDLEHLAVAGVPVAGKIYDVQYAEPLIDENRFSYSLQSIAAQHLGEGKVSDEMYKWSKMAYGGSLESQGANIWRCPVGLVGPYAEGDVDLPLRILEKQRVLLHNEDLWDLFETECSLIPMLLAMRLRGVRVDVAKAERIGATLQKQINEWQRVLNQRAGTQINVHAADSLAKLFDKIGIKYPRTAKTGKPSFVKVWLENLQHPAPEIRMVLNIRKFHTILETFIKGYILEKHVNGRLYGMFHPLRSDDGGTVSGRYSSSLPNLQNIPMRDKTIILVHGVEMPLGQAVRSLFIPDDDCLWTKDDYSQVEFRLITHYGEGESAHDAREAYSTDPTTDFHTLVSKMCGIDRGAAKGINFGLAYNMGEDKLSDSLGIPIDQARVLFKQYHERLPFVKNLQDATSSAAARRGWIRTALGRRARFPLYEPSSWDESKGCTPLPFEAAQKKWGHKIRRAYTYKAMNRLIQGTAADVMKKSMSNLWKSGVCDVLGAPHLTVHDELDWSVPKTKAGAEAHAEVLNIMQTSMKFRVPLICDTESGPNWGEVK
jgi:DNA polymerase I-like protein with 3'-5' exonuclease and polymerase domains